MTKPVLARADARHARPSTWRLTAALLFFLSPLAQAAGDIQPGSTGGGQSGWGLLPPREPQAASAAALLAQLKAYQPRYQPEVAAFLVNQRLAALTFVHSLHDRIGEPQFLEDETPAARHMAGGVWLRTTGRWEGSRSLDEHYRTRSDMLQLQAGGELARWQLLSDSDRLHVGLMGGYAWGDNRAEVVADTGRARGSVEGYNAGIYGTWYQNDENKLGTYADIWFQYGWFHSSVQGDRMPTVNYRATGLAVSGEAGYALRVAGEWVVEPQAQVIYMNYREDDIVGPGGIRMEGTHADGAVTRLGVRTFQTFRYDATRLQPYATLNWWHDITSCSVPLSRSLSPVSSLYPSDLFELRLGLNAALGQRWAAWGNVGGAWGAQSYYQYAVRVGVKYLW